MDDIFCKIIRKEIPGEILLETEDAIAIKDIHPKAPVHVLVIPKKHIQDMSSLTPEDMPLVGKLMLVVQDVAKKLDLGYKGFRLIINQGEHGGQIVPHLHIHILGGRHLGPKIVQEDTA